MFHCRCPDVPTRFSSDALCCGAFGRSWPFATQSDVRFDVGYRELSGNVSNRTNPSLLTQSCRSKGRVVWEDHQARDRRDAKTLDTLATPQFRKRAQKPDRDDGQMNCATIVGELWSNHA